METPYLFPGELIAFTRTVPNLPFVFGDEEWAEIRKAHYIHELGNVSNLSPGYGAVLSKGLLAIRDGLGEGGLQDAMRSSIDALLGLTARYRDAALSAGDAELAEVLGRVPALPPRTFREALQSLRILHFAMWCEGDYHNTLGRFDQYMFPYLRADLDAGRLDMDAAMELLEAFFLACNRDSDLYPGMQQGDNGQSIVLGGMPPDGKDGYNLLSEMCLKASAELRLIDPKINLRVNRDTPIEVYELGTQLTKLGLGFPQYEQQRRRRHSGARSPGLRDAGRPRLRDGRLLGVHHPRKGHGDPEHRRGAAGRHGRRGDPRASGGLRRHGRSEVENPQ